MHSLCGGDRAKERLDILGLDVSGQPVVVELKRGSDSRIHLQAITYASLVAGFSETTLAQAHSDYLNREQGQDIDVDEARRRIAAHIEEGVSLEETLRVPKIVLIAEQFSAQTYTTVSWLAEIAPNLTIELLMSMTVGRTACSPPSRHRRGLRDGPPPSVRDARPRSYRETPATASQLARCSLHRR